MLEIFYLKNNLWTWVFRFTHDYQTKSIAKYWFSVRVGKSKWIFSSIVNNLFSRPRNYGASCCPIFICVGSVQFLFSPKTLRCFHACRMNENREVKSADISFCTLFKFERAKNFEQYSAWAVCQVSSIRNFPSAWLISFLFADSTDGSVICK